VCVGIVLKLTVKVCWRVWLVDEQVVRALLNDGMIAQFADVWIEWPPEISERSMGKALIMLKWD